MQKKDHVSREMVEGMLKKEESHLLWLEKQTDLIKEIGIKNYLAEQI